MLQSGARWPTRSCPEVFEQWQFLPGYIQNLWETVLKPSVPSRTPHNPVLRSWRGEPIAHTDTDTRTDAPSTLSPQLFASYPMVTSIFYFLKTRQFKRRKCSKLAHGKKWQKETMPLYQASNSRAGKGVSIQYVPDS